MGVTRLHCVFFLIILIWVGCVCNVSWTHDTLHDIEKVISMWLQTYKTQYLFIYCSVLSMQSKVCCHMSWFVWLESNAGLRNESSVSFTVLVQIVLYTKPLWSAQSKSPDAQEDWSSMAQQEAKRKGLPQTNNWIWLSYGSLKNQAFRIVSRTLTYSQVTWHSNMYINRESKSSWCQSDVLIIFV